jgi:hypothetical protein
MADLRILPFGVVSMKKPRSRRSRPAKAGQQPADRGDPRLSVAEQRIQAWLEQMEQLRLSEYLRYVQDRRKLFWNSFLSGIARGVGMAIGFTLLGAALVLILQDLARHNLPLIGEWLDKLMQVLKNGIS